MPLNLIGYLLIILTKMKNNFLVMEVEMKKFLIVILILLILFGGYLLYDPKFKEKIPVLEIQ